MNLCDPPALIKARKSSPDWHGVSVLTSLVKFGPFALKAERDTALILAMSPKHQAKAVELFNRFLALDKEVDAFHEQINNEIVEAIK